MNKFIFSTLTFFLCFSPVTFADEIVKTFPAGGAEDVIDMKNPPGESGQGAIQINDECMSTDKKVLKKGQKGYGDCMRQRLNRSNQARPNGSRGVNPMGQPTTPAPGQ